MIKLAKFIGLQPAYISELKSYNSIYELDEEFGFKKQKDGTGSLKRIASDVIIERYSYTTKKDRIVITRTDKQDYKGVLRFFNTVKVPDRIDSKRRSKMSLIISAPTRQDKKDLIYTLKQDISVNDGSSHLYKFKNIKLIINAIEARLIYPNGMGRIYKND